MVYTCKVCDEVFNIYSTYYSHKKTKHEEACIKCKHCDVKFKTIHARNSHYYNVKATKEIVEESKVDDAKVDDAKVEEVKPQDVPSLKLQSQYIPSYLLPRESSSSISKLSYRLFEL
jgi:hypothetical protein